MFHTIKEQWREFVTAREQIRELERKLDYEERQSYLLWKQGIKDVAMYARSLRFDDNYDKQ